MESTIIDTGYDAVLNNQLREPAPYYAKVLEDVKNRPGSWNSQRIGIFNRSDEQLGEYLRNYSSVMRTFHPFKLYGEWYALYSKDYTATRLMKLPSCEDIGGEEREAGGFCPVDYYVPTLHNLELAEHDPPCNHPKRCTVKHRPECPSTTGKPPYGCICKEEWAEHQKTHDIWTFPDRIHGFVAGCVWGDDSSWKIQHLDLSRANEGILVRSERFGYIEMGADTLEEAIDLDDDLLTVSVLKRVSLGKVATEDRTYA